MSLLDRLGIDATKRKSANNQTPAVLTFKQKQEAIKRQNQATHRSNREAHLSKRETPRVARECPVCQKPMYVAVGQLQFSHRECRARAKRVFTKREVIVEEV